MSVVIPAILPSSEDDLREKVGRVTGLVDSVQIDVVDGLFAKPATWPYVANDDFKKRAATDGWLRDFGELKYEIDLMVAHPEESAGAWIAAGATRITVHVESTRYLPHLLDELRDKYGYEKGFAPDLLSFGLAINVETESTILEQYIEHIDYVQFMGIRTIGKQGQPFDERVVSKLKSFRKAHPDLILQVDGGVTLNTAPALLDAGVNRLVVGHDLFEEEDIGAEYARYLKLYEEHGRYY